MADQSSDRTDPPELLAPAGDRECMCAAIENGADAVYFGLDDGFNARIRAKNISVEDLPDAMQMLHRRGVLGYVTLNTLIFPGEVDKALQLVRRISDAGVDAVLVQDLGLVRLIREATPDLPIHASTQMTMTSAPCIDEIASLGIERVVVGRELSVREIKAIHSATTMPLEVFVHGALCVAYSGQCLTSESLGGRSANRGQCAQACRLPYDLIVDGKDRDLGDHKYLLSPQDLAAYALIPDLMDAGVCSLKIEGRLKSPEYVANITRHYRAAIDQAIAEHRVTLPDNTVREMELSFSRGFSHGWLGGNDHKMLVPGLSSAKRGIPLGSVQRVGKRSVVVRLDVAVKPGDGVVFDGDRASGDEQGGRVFEVLWAGGDHQCVELRFARNAIDFGQLYPGQRLWKTDDPELNRRLRKTFQSNKPLSRRGITIRARAATGQPLTLKVYLEGQCVGEIHSEQPMVEATKHPLTLETLRGQFGRLGKTAYELQDVTAKIAGRPMLPLSVLGRMRKEIVNMLDEFAVQPRVRRTKANPLEVLRAQSPTAGERREVTPRLQVMCRTVQQIEEVLRCGVKDLYADFHDIRQYRQAVEIARSHDASIFLATPRIQKPDEYGLFRVLMRHAPDGYLVRNLAGLGFYSRRDCAVVADFSLNATNDLTADFLLERGATRFTPSYDLNRQQLIDLIETVRANTVEVVVHQHMPMFHMEHCVFCSVLSPGTNKTNCGRPCDRHRVELRDRVGMEHSLQADVGCRNTLFNASAQSAAEVIPTLQAMSVGCYRIELLEETADEIRDTISLYQSLLRREVSGHEVWTRLRAVNRVGVTRGTLEEKRNPLAIL